MLIKSETELKREAQGIGREAHEQKLADWISHQARNTLVVEDNDLNPGNAARQLGRPMASQAFEKRLRKILPPNCIFISNPNREGFRAIVKKAPDGSLTTLCPYKAGIMPEHSICRVKHEWVRDMEQKHIDRKDLPKHEIVPGKGVVWESDARPGWKKIWHILGEDPDGMRGWRSVLIRLVQHRVLTPIQVERVFGSDDRAHWAVGMGKRTEVLSY